MAVTTMLVRVLAFHPPMNDKGNLRIDTAIADFVFRQGPWHHNAQIQSTYL